MSNDEDGILLKPLRYGISGRMYNWTKSYMYNRRARVLVDGQCGRKVLLKQGASILSGVSSKVSLPSWILGESVKRVPVVFFLC
jgi:hypothetical protein